MKTLSLIPNLLLILLLCINESTSYALDNLPVRGVELSFQLGNIKDITVLAHPVCSFRHPTEKNLNNYIFAEGDICLLEGGRCEYHALMNINGKDVKLRKILSNHKSTNARFKVGNTEVEVDYGQTKCFPNKNQCESAVLSAILTVFQGKSEKHIKVIGECGD